VRAGVVRVLALVAIAVAFAVGTGGRAAAQVGEAIRRYEVQITIEPAGELRVRERIAYDFDRTSTLSPTFAIAKDLPPTTSNAQTLRTPPGTEALSAP
jgi:hypothetical protein